MEPYYVDDSVTLLHGDCRELLPSLPHVDLLLTDPPYGLQPGARAWRRNGTALEDWTSQGHNVAVDGWRQLVSIETGWIVEFGVQAGNDLAVASGHRAVGWKPNNFYALVKSAPAPTPRPGFCSALELALVSKAGQPSWYGTGYTPNRWIGMTPNRAGNASGHPTQKPLEPTADLVRVLTAPGGLVLDPFAGSGTTLRAAKDEGRRAIGVEVEERYCEVAAKRLAQGVLDFGGTAS